MISSGTTAVSTSSDTAVTLIAADPNHTTRYVDIVNEGSVAGFFSVDGGNTWGRLPATSALHLTFERAPLSNVAILVKRVASGSNLATVWGFAY